MNILFSLNKFLDSTWKIVLALIFVIIVFFAIFGLIGRLIEMIFKHQAKKVDKFMSPMIVAGLIDDDKDFGKVALRKSKTYFFKTSCIPLLLIVVGVLTWVIYHSICGNWGESIFNDYSGIGTLFWTWDFSNAVYYPPLGFDGIVLQNTPHFLTDVRMINYFIFLFTFIGLVWYLINVQAYFARYVRIKKLQDSLFSQNLDNIDLATLFSGDFTKAQSSNNQQANPNQNNE